MNTKYRDPPARVEKYKTSEGKVFVIARRPRRGRKYQEPQPTGDKVDCPYCSQEHDVVYYLVTKGRRGEKKVRTWICPMVGKLPLNQGRKWDEYIESIIVRPGSEVEPLAHLEAQTSEGDTHTWSRPDSIEEILEKMRSDIDWSSLREKKPKEEVGPALHTPRSLAEFQVGTFVRPKRTSKVRQSYTNAIRRFVSESPPSLNRSAERYISSFRATRRVRSRKS
jgi:hypothetical protein